MGEDRKRVVMVGEEEGVSFAITLFTASRSRRGERGHVLCCAVLAGAASSVAPSLRWLGKPMLKN